MVNRPSIRLNDVDIEWNLERGNVSFFGLDSVLFWTNPSMYRLLAPLVEELGPGLFRLLVAHSSSLGTDADYEMMVTKLGTDFVSGFLAWGEAVATAGWGRFEVLAFDPVTCTADVRVSHPWELEMQRGSPVLWGCPFMQGKIIGLFTHAFNRPCWADETVLDDPEHSFLDLHVYPSDRELGSELEVLRLTLFTEHENQLVRRIDAATAELNRKIAVIDEQRALIARLTYPILQVWDGVLAAVLLGELTEAAMSDLTYTLLLRVQATGAHHVILDCTGVPSLSVPQTAALAGLVAAVRLLGSKPTLVGLCPAVAKQLATESSALAGTRVLQTLADALERIIGLRRG
jgi:rsbT co-antagonist protein RsbR